MSFPPRPPMGMPPMMPQGYGFAPMGMMPMGMQMMPTTMMRPSLSNSQSSTSSSTVNSSSRQIKKLIPQEIPKDSKDKEKPPVTTVFVGNISDRAPDAMVRQMLQRCGNVLSWKRVQGASGKLQAFGFCEYEYPEATLRCIRLLNEWIIADKKLVVKVDAKTKTLLDDYKRKKEGEKQGSKSNGDSKDSDKEEGETDDKPIEVLDEELDEMTQREDRVAKAGLDAIMREYAEDLNKTPHSEIQEEIRKERRQFREQLRKEKEEAKKKDEGLEELGLDNDQKSLIDREIRSFRDAHKDENVEETDEAKAQQQARRDYERDRREREKERREREKKLREREREREIERKARERSRSPSRTRERERDYDRDRDRDRRRGRGNSRDVSRERDDKVDDEEEAYERRKLERKLQEKEESYQERLKNWEQRERKKAREYEKEEEKEIERKEEEAREARRLKEFLEDYDDERDDPKYFKGSALQRRLKEREREMEADARDRQREKEEIEEIRQRLMEQGHPDPEAEMARIERERDEHLMPRLNKTPSPSPEREVPPAMMIPQQQSPTPITIAPVVEAQPIVIEPKPIKLVDASPSDSSRSSASPDVEEDDYSYQQSAATMSNVQSEENSNSISSFGPATREDNQSSRLGFSGLKLGASDSPLEAPGKKKKLTIGDVFNQDDEESNEGSKKRKLIPLDYEEEKSPMMGSKPTTAEEKRKCIKNLIEKIPTAKSELFTYPLDWTMVDTTLMDRRIKPWVNKKIVEYIGEEEPTLTDFICQKVMAHSTPQQILNDVAMVLDEEAEVFVVKMWRLLIYETEAKKLGLVK